MDLASLLGLIGGLGIVLVAIMLGGDLGAFVDIPSILIVVVGSLFVVMMRYPLGQFLGMGGVLGKAFMFKAVEPNALIEESVELANIARKEGVLALEGKEIGHPFLQKGIALCIDGHGPDVVQKMLNKDMSLAVQRHGDGAQIFKAMGDAAPAMGMIGTLVGLVQMLGNMEDPKSIGPAMAVALLTTLYGAMVANIFGLPVSDKLKLRAQQEELAKSLILEAVAGIQEGVNPRVLEQLLKSYLPERKREAA
ncbi:MAG: flagellar motor protein PomA [Gammaproteobacteria bacterium]|nr:flagellar motor protein PomA [Gammaproteobacteria bacterium]